MRTSGAKLTALGIVAPAAGQRRTGKLGKVAGIAVIVIAAVTLASSQFSPRPPPPSDDAASPPRAADIQAGLVRSLPFPVKCELMILTILWLTYSLRLRMIAGRLRVAAASARLNERERIARELHDTLLQGVQGLMLRLQAVAECVKSEPEQAHQLIEQALARADAVLEEGRDCVNDLRTINKPTLELSRMFLRVAEEAQPHPARIRVTVEGAMREFLPIVREEIEKIGIEAMTNALLHAEASMIDVDMLFQRRRFALRISDDGIGIDPAILGGGRERHFGLTGMRERARRIRGRISIASRPGGGTEIELVISGAIAYRARRRGLGWGWRLRLI